jgi:hypothetical protein
MVCLAPNEHHFRHRADNHDIPRKDAPNQAQSSKNLTEEKALSEAIAEAIKDDDTTPDLDLDIR